MSAPRACDCYASVVELSKSTVEQWDKSLNDLQIGEPADVAIARTVLRLNDALFDLRDAKKRYAAAFVRIAKAHGIDSPLVLMAMAENDEENYAEILARHIEKSHGVANVDLGREVEQG